MAVESNDVFARERQPDGGKNLPSAAWERLERVLERFEDAWRRGERPTLEAYLAEAPAERSALLPELAHADLHYRLHAGEAALVEDYLRRYPELAEDRAAVLDLVAAEYEARQRCGGTPTPEEYRRRFPQLREELTQRLRQAAPAQLPLAEAPPAAGNPGPRPENSDPYRTRGSGADPSPPQSGALPVAGGDDARPAPPVIDPDRSDAHAARRGDFGGPPPESGAGAGTVDTQDLENEGQAAGPAPDPYKTPQGQRDPYLTRQTHAVAAAEWSPAEVPTIGGYEVLGWLGRGGMGVVYKARQVRLKRLVALKMILGGPHAHADQTARFRAEAEAVARLQHPNIVQVYEVGEDQGRPYFSLEFVEGGSLDKKLAGTPLPARTAAQLVQTLARAMEAAHQRGIVHRDLKPANILLAGGPDVSVERGTPKITDFGLAKRLDDDSARTQSGAILGTPSYMAPEQAMGNLRLIGPLADVYALGAILYECLTGRPPFKAATLMETLEQVRSDEPVPPGRLQPKVPRDLETICLKCLEKPPQGRYASAGALADDLQHFLDGEPIWARRVRLWERAVKWTRRRPTAAALVGVLVFVGLALPAAGLQFAAQRAQRRETEQKHLEGARSDVRGLHAQGQTAVRSGAWRQADVLLTQALDRIEAEPALADLRPDVEAARAPVRERLAALDTHERFVRDRNEALFHATLATGEDYQTNRTTAREKGRAALACVGLSPEGPGALTLSPAFTREEKAEIVSGCYALLLMLAEIEGQRLPHHTAAEHRQRLRQALDLLDRAGGLGVRTRAIHLRRARYLAALGNEAGAAKERGLAQALVAETDLDPQDHFLVGHEFYSQGKLEPANQEFLRALQLDSGHFWTHYFLGICCLTASKPELAVAHFTICQSRRSDLVWIYLLRGFALGEMQDYSAAEADFSRALALEPSLAARYVLYNNRGVMRVGQKGARAEGLKDLERAAELRPEQYQAHASLAEAYGLDGRLDDAGRRLDQAITLVAGQVKAGEPKSTTLALLHHRRARLHLQRGDRAAAVRDLEEAARLAEDDPALRAQAHLDRGGVLHLQERFDEALAAYGAALQADPERVDVYRRRGEVLLVLERYCEAAAAFDAYLEDGGPPSAAVYRQRGLAFANLGLHAEAIDDFSRALEAKLPNEERASLYLSRGQVYLASNALELALRDFEETLRLDPGRADAYLGRAYARVKLGDAPPATADADRAVKGEPGEARLWYGAACVYAQAAGQGKAAPGQEKSLARVRAHYQARALGLLRTALERVPGDQRQAYWREVVLKEAALYPIRRLPGFVDLADRFGVRDR
jgi:tetratricopeptide (TPR) repeat protein